MFVPALVLLTVLASPADTGRVAPDTMDGGRSARLELPVSLQIAPDTLQRRRRKAIEVSDWYERRLRIHRYGAYTVIPLFTFQAIAGDQLYKQGAAAPAWAKTGHRVGATGLAAVFGVNTVTGLWNLWDSRTVPQGRTKRTIHTLLMLASDAGFTYAGARLSEQAESSGDKRRQHRNLAYASMATALTGTAVMLFWRKD